MSELIKKYHSELYEYITGYFGTLFLIGAGAVTLLTFLTFIAMFLEV